MDFNGIKEIVEMINSSEIAYFNYKTCDGHLVLDKSLIRSSDKESIVVNEKEAVNEILDKKLESVEKNVAVTSSEVEEEDSNLTTVTSPMVGTFYSSSSPEADPFVNVGSKVQKGSILCIVEAMKLMNEIDSDVSGTVISVLVKDGDMVEYGQPLFKIKED